LLTPKSILCMVGLFLIIAVAFRYVSLGSVAVAAAFPLVAWALHEYVDSRQLIFIALVSLLVIWKHRQNIGRLAAGTESKLGTKSESKLDTESETLGATRRCAALPSSAQALGAPHWQSSSDVRGRTMSRTMSGSGLTNWKFPRASQQAESTNTFCRASSCRNQLKPPAI